VYKFGPYQLQYLGTDPNTYKKMTFNFSALEPIPQNTISQVGNGDWSDLVSLVVALNESNAQMSAYAHSHVNVPAFYRHIATDAALRNADSYFGTGNNFALANSVSSPAGPFFRVCLLCFTLMLSYILTSNISI
jgi:hypothetical protein